MWQELEKMVDTYSEKLLRYATSILYNYQDAEDVVQDVFMAACQTAQKGDNLNAWLYKVTYNKCLNKLKRRRLLFFGGVPEDTIAPQGTTGLSDEMYAALGTLKPHDRALIYLRIVEGYNYDELSSHMGTSPAALRKRYERAKAKLAKYLVAQGATPEQSEEAEAGFARTVERRSLDPAAGS